MCESFLLACKQNFRIKMCMYIVHVYMCNIYMHLLVDSICMYIVGPSRVRSPNHASGGKFIYVCLLFRPDFTMCMHAMGKCIVSSKVAD